MLRRCFVPQAPQFLVLLALIAPKIRAQDTDSKASPSPASLSKTISGRPSTLSSTPLSSTPTSFNSPSDSPSHPGHANHNASLLNYYFLLLAIFIVILIVVYHTVLHKRRRSQLQSRHHQTDALNQDLSHHGQNPSIGRSHAGRFRRWRGGIGSGGTTFRSSLEGLDERGEAPPPYVKEPERAHLDMRRSQEVELRQWEEHPRGKPPDYEENNRRMQS